MKPGNWMAIATVVVFATSCGESSTKESGTTTNVTTTETKMPEVVPVAATIVVPEPTKSSFETKYPTVSNVSWSRYEPVNTFDWEWAGWSQLDTADYMVSYKMDNNDYWTWYDNENNWIGTVNTITNFSGLPEAVNSSIQSNFPGYTIVSIDKENDKNRTAYELELTKGEDKMKTLIDEQGTILKKKSTVGGEKMKEKNM
ncbi:MAG: hypothetical protein SGI83_15395 [Bacteroidota bacterium]|nr:hypothetical protein [Bacteroidota bacterium]